MKDKKVNFLLIAILMIALMIPGGVVKAEEESTATTTTTSTETTVDAATTEVAATEEATTATTVEEIAAEDLGVAEPSVLPGSIFYPFKRMGEAIQETFTFNPEKKAQLAEKFANKRLVEARALARDGKTDEAVKVLGDYQNRLEQAQARLSSIDRSQLSEEQIAKLEKVEDRLTANLLKQQRVLEKVENGMPEDKKEKVRERLADTQEKLEERMSKLPAEDQEKAKARLDEIMKQLPGDEVDRAAYIEAMKAVRTEVVPEVVRANIEQKATEQQAKIEAAVAGGKITAEQAQTRLEAVKVKTESRLQNLETRTEAKKEIQNIREQAKDLGVEAKEETKKKIEEIKTQTKQTIDAQKETTKEELKANAQRALEQKKKEALETTNRRAEELKNMVKSEPKTAQ